MQTTKHVIAIVFAAALATVAGPAFSGGSTPCCDPAQEPGHGGNPLCIEGATCCTDGTWQCNDAMGTPTCRPGDVCPELCEGFAGIPCDDPEDFCKHSVGECCCDFFGVCTEIPTACPDIHDPVCGCDGVTYDNECFADAAGVSIDHLGSCDQVCGGITGIPCDDGEFCKLSVGECCCDHFGVCTAIPTVCPENYDPVCGCDGVTYDNACFADAAGASIDHVGRCDQVCGGITGIPCDDGEFCLLPPGGCCCDFQGVCVSIPQDCPHECDPVCGCDGRTYKNRCLAIKAGTSVDHAGPCYAGGGLITGVEFDSKDKSSWDPQDGALYYNVYRAVVEWGPPLSAGECFVTGLEEPIVAVSGEPHAGVLWLFQVSGQYAGGEGPLGINWTCQPLMPAEPCSSSERILCEETGGTWDPFSCGHYPCGQFPACDAIIPGCNCGPGSNFVAGTGCMPDPACGPFSGRRAGSAGSGTPRHSRPSPRPRS